MSPDQMAQMAAMMTDRSNASTEPVYQVQAKHPGGTGSR
jgi:hypothetical protein